MFNRRNFAQIIASLVPLPFLRIDTPEILTDPENIENLPVVRFEAIKDYGCSFAPEPHQFDKEFEELMAQARNSDEHFSGYKYIQAWVKKENMLRSTMSCDGAGYWGKVEITLHFGHSYISGQYVKTIIIKSTEESIKIKHAVTRGWNNSVVDI